MHRLRANNVFITKKIPPFLLRSPWTWVDFSAGFVLENPGASHINHVFCFMEIVHTTKYSWAFWISLTTQNFGIDPGSTTARVNDGFSKKQEFWELHSSYICMKRDSPGKDEVLIMDLLLRCQMGFARPPTWIGCFMNWISMDDSLFKRSY